MRVLFFSGSDCIGRMIRWRTGSPYSHVAVMIGDTLYEAVRSGVRKLEGLDAGMRAAQAAKSLSFDPEPEMLRDAVAWLEDQVGDGYAFEEIVGILLGLVLARPNHWICSSYNAPALRLMGVLKDNRLDDRMQSPGSLARALGA